MVKSPAPWTKLSSIREKRRELNAIDGRAQQQFWSTAELKLLGTASDVAIARKLKRDRTEIQRKRANLGIPAFGPHRWSPREDAMIGTTLMRILRVNSAEALLQSEATVSPSLRSDTLAAKIIGFRRNCGSLGR